MGETDSGVMTVGFVLGLVFGFVDGFPLLPLFPVLGFVVMGGFGEKPGVVPNTNISETRIIAARTATVA